MDDRVDANLLVVLAVDGYARQNNIDSGTAFERMNARGVVSAIRDNYAALHTQSPDEVVGFACDIMARREASHG